MTAQEVVHRIAEAVRDGQLDRLQAERLLGFVLLESALEDFWPDELPNPSTFYRRCRHLRPLGLVDDNRYAEPVKVLGLQPSA